MNKLMAQYFSFLQIFDMSLAIDIRDDRVYMLSVRKLFYGYKIVYKDEFTVDTTSERNLFNKIADILKQKRLRATHVIINFPTKNFLIKSIETPFIPLDAVEEYMYQHPEFYLPPGLTLNEVKLDFKILQNNVLDRNRMKILVFIIKKQLLNDFLNQVEPINVSHIVYRTFSWSDTISHYHPDFTGLVIEVDEKEVIILTFRNGCIENFSRLNPVEELSSKYFNQIIGAMEKENTEFKIIFSGRLEKIQYLKRQINDSEIEKKEILLDLKNFRIEPDFYLSYNMSTIPFLKEKPISTLSHFDEHKNHRYNHLVKKNIGFLAILFMAVYLSLMSMNTSLKLYKKYFLSKYNDIKPLLTKREELLDNYKTLEEFWEDVRFLDRGDTYIAKYLKIIVEQMPPLLWFSKISVELEAPDGLKFHLSGFAQNDRDFYLFLERLQRNNMVKKIEIESFKVRERKEIQEKFKIPSKLIYIFNLKIYA